MRETPGERNTSREKHLERLAAFGLMPPPPHIANLDLVCFSSHASSVGWLEVFLRLCGSWYIAGGFLLQSGDCCKHYPSADRSDPRSSFVQLTAPHLSPFLNLESNPFVAGEIRTGGCLPDDTQGSRQRRVPCPPWKAGVK